MMTENVENGFENAVRPRTAVPAPRFEDRIVVSAAQPVVPLKEIHRKERRRRMWFLGAAFAIAIVLGAASALVAVQLKRIAANDAANSEATKIEEPAQETVTAEAQTLPVETEPMPDVTVVEEEEQPAVATLKRQPPVAQRPRVAERQRERLGGRGVQPNEQEELEQIREAVLYEQWQERRMRRAERRERRNRGDRDLSQVDELFEGPRRRERP